MPATIDPQHLRELFESGMTWDEVGEQAGLSGKAAANRYYRWKEKREREEEQVSIPIDLPDDFELYEALEIADRIQNLMDLVDPIVTCVDLEFPPEPIAIMWTSCAHLGGRYTWHEKVRDTLDKIQLIDRLYVVLLGDEIEGFLPGFRDASAVSNQVLPVKVQIKMLSAYLKRWSDSGKCLFGCHSEHGGKWFEGQVGINPIKSEFQSANTPFFDGKGIAKAKVGDEQYVLVAAHTFKGTSIYNPNHPQRRASLFDYPSADIVAMGGKHRYAIQNMSDRVDEYHAGLRASPKVWHIQVGTAKVGPDPYTIRGWQKGFFEWPVTVLYPDRHVIKQVFELDDLEYFLGRG